MKKAKKSRFRLVVMLAFIVYFSIVAIDQQNILNAKKAEMDKVQSNIAKEEEINAELKKQKDMLNSDEYYEKVAREQLGMLKPGEKVFFDVGK